MYPPQQAIPPGLQATAPAISVAQTHAAPYYPQVPTGYPMQPQAAPYYPSVPPDHPMHQPGVSSNQVHVIPPSAQQNFQPNTFPPVPAEGPPAGAADITNVDRWNVVFAAVRAYYLFDATKAFFMALLGMLVTLIAFLTVGSGSCSQPMWVPSVLIFITRCLDIALGCGTLCCRLCCPPASQQHDNMNPNHKNPKKQAFGRFALNNLCICSIQIILAVVQIAMAVAGLTSDTEDCASSTVTIVFAVLFLIDATQELIVWAICYHMYLYQEHVQLPGWFDCLIFPCLRETAANM